MYIITGTPRSGLNLVSQCLNILGIKPLTHKDAADADTINQLLFQDLGVSSYSPALPKGWMESDAAHKARGRIDKLLGSQLSVNGYPLLGKTSDQLTNNNLPGETTRNEFPKGFHLGSQLTCVTNTNPLLTALWQTALAEASITPHYILMLRHPWETAQSLAANHNLDLQSAHILWLGHTRAALRDLEGQDYSLVTYDQLLADPISTLDSFLPSSPNNCLPRERNQNDFPKGFHWGELLTNNRALLDFIHPNQKHHQASDFPETEAETYKSYARLYDHIRAQHISTGKISEDSPAPPARLNQAKPDCGAEFNLVNRLAESSPQGIQPGWAKDSSDLIDSLIQALGQNSSQITACPVKHLPSVIHEVSCTAGLHRGLDKSSRRGLTGDIQITNNRLTATLSTPNTNPTHHQLPENKWQKLSFPIPNPAHIRNEQLLFQPLNTHGTVSIASITLMNRATGEEVLGFKGDGFDELDIQGTAVRLPNQDNLVLLVTGEEPLVGVPVGEVPDCPLEVVVWLKGSRNANQIKETLQSHVPQSMPTLQRLYSQHEGKVSDKWDLYLTEYDNIFKDYRNSPINLLEIGVQNGGSLEIWSKYFPYAELILGCDIIKDCEDLVFENPKISVVIGDINTDNVHNTIRNITNNFNIIIDDGSHYASDVIKGFASCFPMLTYDGIYVVEDMFTSYWKQYNGGLFYPFSAMQFFKYLADIINSEHWGVKKSELQLINSFFENYDFRMNVADLKEIHSITFMNSLCVIRKKPPDKNILGKRYVAGRFEKISKNLYKLNRTVKEPNEIDNEWSDFDNPSWKALLKGINQK